MKKLVYILLTAIFGLFFFQTKAFACKPGAKAAHAKHQTHEKLQKECCAKDGEKHQTHKQGCGKNCSHSACKCQSVCNGMTFVNAPAFIYHPNNFSVAKESFHHTQSYLLSGFYTIWLPPKIS